MPDLDGSADWRLLRHASRVSAYALELTLDGADDPICAILRNTGGPTLFFVQ